MMRCDWDEYLNHLPLTDGSKLFKNLLMKMQLSIRDLYENFESEKKHSEGFFV